MEKEKEIEVWLARDDYGPLYMFTKKPKKDVRYGLWKSEDENDLYIVPQEWFPNIRYSDKEATKVKLTLIDKQ